jgi:hypothetical protein
MNKTEDLIRRNIELSAEFGRYVFEHPEIEERLALDAQIVLLPEDDNALKDFNLATGGKLESEGKQVTYVTIKKMRPRALSRIEELELSSG